MCAEMMNIHDVQKIRKLNFIFTEFSILGNICNRLSHAYTPTYKVQTSLILCRKDCSLRYGISAKFPGGGWGGEGMTIWPTVYKISSLHVHNADTESR